MLSNARRSQERGRHLLSAPRPLDTPQAQHLRLRPGHPVTANFMPGAPSSSWLPWRRPAPAPPPPPSRPPPFPCAGCAAPPPAQAPQRPRRMVAGEGGGAGRGGVHAFCAQHMQGRPAKAASAPECPPTPPPCGGHQRSHPGRRWGYTRWCVAAPPASRPHLHARTRHQSVTPGQPALAASARPRGHAGDCCSSRSRQQGAGTHPHRR